MHHLHTVFIVGSSPTVTTTQCLRTLIGSADSFRNCWLGVRIRPKVPSYGGRTREVMGSMGPEVHHHICPCTLIGSAGRLKICWLAVRICPGVPVMSLSSNGRTLIKVILLRIQSAQSKFHSQGRDPGSNPGNDTKLRIRTAKSFMTRWFDSNICLMADSLSG